VLLGRGLDGRCIEEVDQLLPGKIRCSSSRCGVDVKIRTGRQAAATGLVVVFTFLLDRRQHPATGFYLYVFTPEHLVLGAFFAQKWPHCDTIPDSV
jgi:hypothetical protein